METKIEDLAVLVAITPPKPNPLFTEFQHKVTRFLRYTKSIPCAHCGRRSRLHWTQLTSFCVMDGESFVLRPGAPLLPGTPVCTKHILGPAVLPAPRKKGGKDSPVNALIRAAETVIANWESGDLAGAVRGLDAAIANAKGERNAKSL